MTSDDGSAAQSPPCLAAQVSPPLCVCTAAGRWAQAGVPPSRCSPAEAAPGSVCSPSPAQPGGSSPAHQLTSHTHCLQPGRSTFRTAPEESEWEERS